MADYKYMLENTILYLISSQVTLTLKQQSERMSDIFFFCVYVCCSGVEVIDEDEFEYQNYLKWNWPACCFF